MSALSHQFRVRLCNFKADGVIHAPRAAPPFCIRGSFDGRAFNSENFHGATMAPMWALDVSFDYHASTIEALATKYLVVECYGGELFLGMCRVDLMALATGPRSIHLGLKEGSRVNGTLSFECVFELVANVTLQLSRVALTHIAPRGYENNPSPYLAFGFADGSASLESPIAANAQSPEWERLPSLHLRTTYQALCDQRVRFELKHSRNGFTAGISDPLMAVFDLALDTLPIEVGRDSAVPFRQMVHSLPNYPFPFSTELHGIAEFRNVHRVVQQKTGILTDEGVVGGAALLDTNRSFASGFNAQQARLSSPQRHPPPPALSPAKPHAFSSSNVSFNASAAYPPLPPPQQVLVYSAPPPPPPSGGAAGTDLAVLDDVAHQQVKLVQQIQTRLQNVNGRRTELTHLIAAQKLREDAEVEAASQRRTAIDADMRMALAERERLEASLRAVQLRREEEARLAAQLAAERERAKRALEAEQQEVAHLQQRVNVLRAEMTKHLEEEERRYQQRVREAEEARRRTMLDAEALAALESRLSQAEARAMQRSKLASPSRMR